MNDRSNLSADAKTSLQNPLNSRFNAASTASEVIKGIDLRNKTAIVTGGYAGLGLETTKVLYAAGARVIVPARDYEKAFAALKDLDGVEIEQMDLMEPGSVDAFTKKFVAAGQALHLLINNAGIMFAPLKRNSFGYESHFATNHLGHFQLTLNLWPALQKANGARVVSLSSLGHRISTVNFADPNFENRSYDRLEAYGQSKTANSLFAVALDKLGKTDGIRAFAVHPGGILSTDLVRHISIEELRAVARLDDDGKPVVDPDAGYKSIEQGAATTIWCAVSPQLDGLGGVYCENCDISRLMSKEEAENWSPVKEDNMGPGVMDYAVDPEAAQHLWNLSEQLTGIKFSGAQ